MKVYIVTLRTMLDYEYDNVDILKVFKTYDEAYDYISDYEISPRYIEYEVRYDHVEIKIVERELEEEYNVSL